MSDAEVLAALDWEPELNVGERWMLSVLDNADALGFRLRMIAPPQDNKE